MSHVQLSKENKAEIKQVRPGLLANLFELPAGARTLIKIRAFSEEKRDRDDANIRYSGRQTDRQTLSSIPKLINK